MTCIEDLSDLVHAELQDVMAGVRPPESGEYVRHLPDAQVIEFLIQDILLPVVTGVASGILTNWISGHRSKKNTDDVQSQIKDMSARLESLQVAADLPDKNKKFDENADAVLQLSRDLRSTNLPMIDTAGIEKEVAATLERFHVGPYTARLKAKRIVDKIIKDVLEP